MLIALVVFCLLFRALEILVNHEPVNAETLLSGFYEIFSGTSWSHVWYLYLMIGIYLLCRSTTRSRRTARRGSCAIS